MTDQEKFEFAFLSANSFHTKAELQHEWDQCHSGVMFRAGLAASQSPKEALSNAEIDDMIFGYAPSCPLDEGRDLARAIEAASGPNAALVEALKAMLSEFNFDTVHGCVHDEKAAINKAIAALAAVGVEP